ncbi:MAG: heavy metal translocating P-type ATPase [bacterium]
MNSAVSGKELPLEQRCSLCGLPLGRRRIAGLMKAREMWFCCPGCKAVYEILTLRHGTIPQEPTNTELFRECLRAGIVLNPHHEEDEEVLDSEVPDLPDSMELSLRVQGMGCPACAWLLEKVLEKTEGVQHVKVSFGSDTARIRYQPSRVTPKEIISKMASLGYKAYTQAGDGASGKHKGSWIRLGVSALLSAHVMMISWALYLGFVEELSRESVLYLSIPLLGLSTPVLFWCGLPVLRRGLLALRHLSPNMETLVGLGALSAYSYSLMQFISGGLHLYFDTASMLITLVLMGRYLEQRARSTVATQWLEGIGAAFQKARLMEKGSPRWVRVEQIKKGDVVLVEEGEGVPVDGLVEKGEGTLDLSVINGESKPVGVGQGDGVLAGSFLVKGSMIIRAKEDGQKSVLASMSAMVEEALSRPWAWERAADRISRWFVVFVAFMAVATAAWVWGKGGGLEDALLRGLTLLVVACPCALGVATPLARVAAVGLGRKLGICIRDPEVLESGGRIQSLVLDKTGTLTQGVFSVQELICFQEKPQVLLSKACSVELCSNHFLARKVVDHARKCGINPKQVEGFHEESGQGVCGFLDGVRICVGNRAWMCRWGLEMTQEQEREASMRESQGFTVVFIGWEARVRGALVLGDSLKPGALEAVSALKQQEMEIWLVSGDSPLTTSWVANQLGLERFLGGALPMEKASFVERLSQEGKRVAVVGDGINDAPAMSLAHLSIALGNGLGPPSPVASVQVSRSDPRVILDVLAILRRARRTVLQNLIFSLFYNSAAIPAAVVGLLNPPLAAAIMFASSLTVIFNSRRLFRTRPEQFNVQS